MYKNILVPTDGSELSAKALRQAAKLGCDLVVMGSHGRHGLAGLMLGSVATKTVTHAHVPVLICRT